MMQSPRNKILLSGVVNIIVSRVTAHTLSCGSLGESYRMAGELRAGAGGADTNSARLQGGD
jgi:hypothetical protein